MAKKIIHVSGLPRAMTTLMCNILTNNPKIKGGETSPLLEYIYSTRNTFNTTPEVRSALTEKMMKDSYVNFLSKGMDGYADIMCGETADIYLDKSRGWVHYSPLLWEIKPDAKIIVGVRDLRAVVASFEKKWRKNPLLIDGRDVPNQQAFITVEQRVSSYLSDSPLGITLKRLYNSIQTGTLSKMLVVKAENLSSNPADVMKKVYEFIGEEYYDLDYKNIKQMTVENDRIESFSIYGDHKIRNEVTPLKTDYFDILGLQICEAIKKDYSWYFETFGYN